MSPNHDDAMIVALLELVAAAQAWRQSLIPKTTNAGKGAVDQLLAALDNLDRLALAYPGGVNR